jgi:1-propanol dehydrogenase
LKCCFFCFGFTENTRKQVQQKGAAMGEFRVRTRIMIGDQLDQLVDGMNKVFVVADHFLAVSHKVSYVTDRLDRAGKKYDVFSDVAAEPDLGVVTAGIGRLTALEPDTVICLGGGASIDAAKAIVFIARRMDEKYKNIRFIAIPTTSGTGSEVSTFAVITDKSTQTKYPLVDESLVPDIAVLDASLVVSAPPKVTGDTGIDVFTHAVEAYVSKEHNDFSDAMAIKSLQLLQNNLLEVYKNPENLQARQSMHNASCMAGIAFANSGLGLNHGMAHAMGAHFHIPHGRANGILLPYVMSFNAGCHDHLTPTADRYAEIAGHLKLDSVGTRQSALILIRTAKRFMERMNMPATIAAAGVTEADFNAQLDEMAKAALADRCTASNPREVTLEQIKELYRQAFTGRA